MAKRIILGGGRSIGKVHYFKILQEFKKWSPEHAKMITYYRPWGSNSIAVWLDNDMVYKVKRHAPNRFTMQSLSEQDIAKKYNLKQ